MKKVTFKEYFSILFGGLWQGILWVLGLFGYKDENNIHEYEKGASPCLMCRKMIINAGIYKVYVREDKNKYKVFYVQDWISNDELLNGQLEY